ncbi:hypothetical protein Bra5_CH03109 [Rhizobium phaseoli Brasil 5]|nr:hypothetical protein Bra5_CH03109 [Rhizobium phaseoli Brasil 5]
MGARASRIKVTGQTILASYRAMNSPLNYISRPKRTEAILELPRRFKRHGC